MNISVFHEHVCSAATIVIFQFPQSFRVILLHVLILVTVLAQHIHRFILAGSLQRKKCRTLVLSEIFPVAAPNRQLILIFEVQILVRFLLI